MLCLLLNPYLKCYSLKKHWNSEIRIKFTFIILIKRGSTFNEKFDAKKIFSSFLNLFSDVLEVQRTWWGCVEMFLKTEKNVLALMSNSVIWSNAFCAFSDPSPFTGVLKWDKVEWKDSRIFVISTNVYLAETFMN